MTATSAEEFADDLDSDFQWRRTELASLRTEVEKLTRSDEGRPFGRMMLRASIALLYAHWEGFVKQSCQHYLDFISRRRLKYSELNAALVMTALQPMSERAHHSRSELALLADLVRGDGHARARIPRQGVIENGANLRHAELCSILLKVGLRTDGFATRMTLIDHSLCDTRNEIAHGRRHYPTGERVLELHRIVVEMMEQIRTQLLDAVFMKMYRDRA